MNENFERSGHLSESTRFNLAQLETGWSTMVAGVVSAAVSAAMVVAEASLPLAVPPYFLLTSFVGQAARLASS